MDRITMYGTRRSGNTIRARKMLDESGVDYEYVGINKESAGKIRQRDQSQKPKRSNHCFFG